MNGLVLCYGQDGYQVKVPQNPIDTCRYNVKIDSTLNPKISFINLNKFYLSKPKHLSIKIMVMNITEYLIKI